MGHNFKFQNFSNHFGDVLTETEAEDLVNFFFDCEDTTFRIVGHFSDTDKKPARGRHEYTTVGMVPHTIQLFRKHIQESFDSKQSMGGNGIAKSLKQGIGRVLVHEIRHAWQAINHFESGNSVFYKGKYIGRPCERDARSFVDLNSEVIDEILGLKIEKTLKRNEHETCVDDIIDVFSALKSVSISDVRGELQSVGLNNPVMMQKIIVELRKRGTEI